jgi:hypothetical protein
MGSINRKIIVQTSLGKNARPYSRNILGYKGIETKVK